MNKDALSQAQAVWANTPTEWLPSNMPVNLGRGFPNSDFPLTGFPTSMSFATPASSDLDPQKFSMRKF